MNALSDESTVDDILAWLRAMIPDEYHFEIGESISYMSVEDGRETYVSDGRPEWYVDILHRDRSSRPEPDPWPFNAPTLLAALHDASHFVAANAR